MTRVSTIIPVFNNEKYLAEAVASVAAQTDVDQEVWIVDDGSTDDTLALARRLAAEAHPLPIHVLTQPNQRAGAARNNGAAHATGEFLAFLDSDDVWTPGRLRLMLGAFADDPTLDIVFGHVQQFISPELTEAERQVFVCPPDPMPGLHPGGALIRRAAFERSGGFDTQLRHGEIIDWIVRLRESGLKERLLPDVVFRRRIHGGNNILKPAAHTDYLRIVQMTLARRRQNQGKQAE